MSYQPQSEHHRQYEQMYRLGMQGGWTQGATWTKRFLVILAVCWLVAVFSILTRLSSTPLGGIVVALYLTPSAVATGSIWQIFTAPWLGTMCMWSFFFHLFCLLVFGPKVEREWGSSRFLRYYLSVAFVATLLGFLLRLPTPLSVIPASTASAAIFAVMIAYGANWPRDIIWVFGLFPSPVIYVILFLCAVEILSWVLYGAGTLGVDFVASAMGVVLGFGAMKIPFLKAIFVGEKPTRTVSTGKRAAAQEYSVPRPSSSTAKKSSPPMPQQSARKPAKKGKRSGFLEL